MGLLPVPMDSSHTNPSTIPIHFRPCRKVPMGSELSFLPVGDSLRYCDNTTHKRQLLLSWDHPRKRTLSSCRPDRRIPIPPPSEDGSGSRVEAARHLPPAG